MTLSNTSLQGRLTLLVGVFLAGIVIFWITSLTTINKVKIGGEAFHGLKNSSRFISELIPPNLSLLQLHMAVFHVMEEENAAERDRQIQSMKTIYEDSEKTYEEIVKNKEDDQVEIFKHLDENVRPLYQQYYQILDSQFIPNLKSGLREEARMVLSSELSSLYTKQTDAVNKLVAEIAEHNHDDEVESLAAANRGTWTIVVFGVVLMGVCSMLAWVMSKQIVGQVSGSISQMSQMAAELSTVSQQMASNSEETATQAQTVSQAAETVSSSAQTVATSAEEMSASINEIAKNTQDASRVANEAVSTAKDTNDKVSKLGESSAQIGQVINVITSIAQQTDLLALNATIEAARAGEAGKGFAVVANEVKDLAKETSRATEDIRQKIETIQVDTKDAVTAIQRITQIITQINDIQSSIASAVEEQTAVTNEISRGASAAASGSKDIASNIGGVAQAAQETTSGVNITQTRANELEQLSHQLGQLLGVVQTLTTTKINPASKSTLKTGSSSMKRLPRAA